MTRAAFITHVESNINTGGESISNRPLEEESLKCYESWRRLGGQWKDIHIYAICNTGNPPCEDTMKEYRKLGVTFVDNYQEISKAFPVGWFNVPLSGRWAEEKLDYDVFIHTDLDMVLLKEPDEELIIPQAPYVKCAVYSENFPDDMQIVPEYKKLFVTCFISSHRKSWFYTRWFGTMLHLMQNWENKDFDDKENWWKYCNLEEHAVDVMFYEKGFKIEQVHKCQIGNGNAYDTVDSLTDDELKRVFFNHDHFHDECKQQTIKDYVRRMMEMRHAST